MIIARPCAENSSPPLLAVLLYGKENQPSMRERGDGGPSRKHSRFAVCWRAAAASSSFSLARSLCHAVNWEPVCHLPLEPAY